MTRAGVAAQRRREPRRRVSADASGGEVLLTGRTAALAPKLDGVFSEPRGRRVPRNVRDPVELSAAVRVAEARDAALPRDPVCRTAVDPGRAAGGRVSHDTASLFCTLACAAEFARRPAHFAPG